MKTPIIFALIGLLLSLYCLYSLIITALSLVDFQARYREYRKCHKILADNITLLPELMTKYRHTHCQRGVLVSAAKNHGFEKTVEGYFDLMGYRWWHLLPDWFLKKPYKLFTLKFWKQFVGF